MTVRYAQIIAHLKIPPYPTHSYYSSLAIKFNTLSLSKFYLFSFGFVCMGKGHLQMTDFFLLNYAVHHVSSALCK